MEMNEEGGNKTGRLARKLSQLVCFKGWIAALMNRVALVGMDIVDMPKTYLKVGKAVFNEQFIRDINLSKG